MAFIATHDGKSPSQSQHETAVSTSTEQEYNDSAGELPVDNRPIDQLEDFNHVYFCNPAAVTLRDLAGRCHNLPWSVFQRYEVRLEQMLLSYSVRATS